MQSKCASIQRAQGDVWVGKLPGEVLFLGKVLGKAELGFLEAEVTAVTQLS